jgi:hypothetical protein
MEVKMKKKPVVIDLNIIIDPYKLLSIIQGIDKIYSEIIIPLPLSFIEVWHPKWRSFTFKMFEDKSILSADLESFFGFTNGITSSNFVSGMKLLIMAFNKGMVRVVDYDNSFSYEKLGKNILGVKGNFNNIEKIQLSNNKELYINPDLPVSEMLYGMQSDDMFVIYGNSVFLDYWHNKNLSEAQELVLQKAPYSANIDSKLQTLLYTEKIKNLSEVFDYVLAPNVLSKLDIELRNTIDNYSKKKELFIFTLEFASTTTIDTILGAPISSGSLFAYQFIKKLILKTDN